jgi:hypothetical protein
MKLAARGSDHITPAIDRECMQKVRESWTGDFSNKEERDAYMAAMMDCRKGFQW